MKIERGSKLLLDTNILLEATDEGRNKHHQAVQLFQEAHAMGIDLFLATQNLREYLVVATRPVANNGLGMTITDALENIAQFRSRTSLIAESISAAECFLRWANQYQFHGKKLHDLQLLATAFRGGIHAVVTLNSKDFPVIDQIAVIQLEEIER
jgi:predicted nucleic acid-binding protein